MTLFDPLQERAAVEAYVGRMLGARARLSSAQQLAASSRRAPWRLDLELDGSPRSLVLTLDPRRGEGEVALLGAMERTAIPAPRVFGWDSTGENLGMPCFLQDHVSGDPLLVAMLAGEAWADELLVETAVALGEVTREKLGDAAPYAGEGESAADVLESAYVFLQGQRRPVADAAYQRLRSTMPPLPALRFSNGDLWPENLIVRDRRLVAVIDFEHAGFSDPVFEFLLPFFVEPQFRGRDLEVRYCRRLGVDPTVLPWYHALEYFDTWRHVAESGEPFAGHTENKLQAGLERWLEGGRLEEDAGPDTRQQQTP